MYRVYVTKPISGIDNCNDLIEWKWNWLCKWNTIYGLRTTVYGECWSPGFVSIFMFCFGFRSNCFFFYKWWELEWRTLGYILYSVRKYAISSSLSRHGRKNLEVHWWKKMFENVLILTYSVKFHIEVVKGFLYHK